MNENDNERELNIPVINVFFCIKFDAIYTKFLLQLTKLMLSRQKTAPK